MTLCTRCQSTSIHAKGDPERLQLSRNGNRGLVAYRASSCTISDVALQSMRRFLLFLEIPQSTLPQRVILLCALFGVCHTALALNPGRQLGQYRRQSWQSDSGLPQNTVYAVRQTRNGFLWLATEGGLVRFDGFDFRVFDTSNTPQFRSNFVESLTEDRAGALWIGTSDGLLRLRDGQFKAFTTADGLPSNTISGVYQQSSGRLIVATAAGLAAGPGEGELFQEIAGTSALSSADNVSVLPEDAHGILWAGGGQMLLAVPAGAMTASRPLAVTVGAIHAIAAGDAGEIWVGGANGLECFRNGQQCAGALEGRELGSLPSRNVTTLLSGEADGAGSQMWIGTTAGLAMLSDGRIRQMGANRGLAGAHIEKLFLDRSDALWVAYRGGLARMVGGSVEIAPQQTSISGVLSLFEDREGDMWFGTEAGGVTVLRDQPFTSITTQQGLSADFVRAVFQDHSGTIWIGTDKGGLDRLSKGKVSVLKASSGLSSNVVLALAEIGTDLWVGTPDGLTCIHNGKSQLFTADDGLADNFVRSLFADTDGSLWVGTRNGLSHWSGGSFRTYSTRDGLGSDVIGSVLRTRSGVLWVATLGGLSRLQADRFVNFTQRDGLGGDAVTALFEDSVGSLWIGTNESSMTRLRGGRFTPFPAAKTGLPETVYGILEDQAGNLWLSSRKGVCRVALSALNAHADNDAESVPAVSYGAADGMRISECSSGGHPSVWHMRDGTLWFATLKGVAWVNPQTSTKDIPPPPIAIEQVMLDDHPANLTSSSTETAQDAPELVVPAGSGRIAIHYAGLSFLAPQKVRYRYMLQGFDRDWIQAGENRTAYYTNVPPGRYKFLVIASNQEGAWSEHPVTLQLRVQPRFFQTIWFYLLLGALLAEIGYLLYRFRVHTVEAKYQAVMAERGRIAREIHDTLAQGYVGISVQLEVASRLLQTSQSAALEQLDRTKELVRSSLAEARSSIWDLRSQGEDTDVLPSRIAAAAKSKEHSGGPAIALQVHGTHRPLPRSIEDQILRIAQEAVNNAVRHAKATRIGITLTYDARSLHLRVTDNGLGFRPPADSFALGGHFGLQGMRERAEAIGAMLHVDGSSGQGTEVTLRVNVPRESGKGDV